jgi:hypothetical protein
VSTSTWKYVIKHDRDSQSTFDHAKKAFAELKSRFSGTAKVESGPMNVKQANMLRITVLGSEVIVGVLFRDCKTLVQITAPTKMSWAKGMVEDQVKGQIEKLLVDSGASFVQIEEYE